MSPLIVLAVGMLFLVLWRQVLALVVASALILMLLGVIYVLEATGVLLT